jgi:hypothetical protein
MYFEKKNIIGHPLRKSAHSAVSDDFFLAIMTIFNTLLSQTS